MEFRNEYAKFNKFYYQRLNEVFENAKGGRLPAKILVKELEDYNIDINAPVLYKKLVDEEQTLKIDSKKYTLLPMGVINKCVALYFVSDEYLQSLSKSPHITEARFRDVLHRKPVFEIFYYPENKTGPTNESLEKCCAAYIKHYRETLGEVWSNEDFYKRLNELKYLSVKYARDEETGELFVIGFFGALIQSGAGGEYLTNAELFVMPEFRNLGIAQKMVGLSLYQAKENGIKNFDSITYRFKTMDALSFWEKVGASVSGLIHIEGSLPEMLDTIDKNLTSQKKIK